MKLELIEQMQQNKTIPQSLISKECIDLLNYRIEQEEFSSRIYMAMSMWLQDRGFSNIGKLWRTYSDEEMKHADWARTYLLSLGICPQTPALNKPQCEFESFGEIVRLTHAHETEITQQIKHFADETVSEKDHMLYELTLHYLKEQVEEMDKAQNWIDKLATFGENPTTFLSLEINLEL
jgi:ferritin